MPWLDIGEFIAKLLTGELWAVWREHKAVKQQQAEPVTNAEEIDDINRLPSR